MIERFEFSETTEMKNIAIARRRFLYNLGASVGSIAFSAMLAAEEQKTATASGPLSPKKGHFNSKATNCIFLTMEGGPSHIDTFDPKPKLKELHLKEFQRSGEMKSAMESGKRYFVQSPFKFQKAGESGADISTQWKHLAQNVDDICFYRGCQVDSVNHPTAMYQLNSGNRFGGDPAMGAWVTYGLGSQNQNLPGYMVLPEVSYPQGGAANWGNGFLPAHYQGTPLRSQGAPILDLMPMSHVTREHQRENLDLLSHLNSIHQSRHSTHDELAARMDAYELAFRMQAEVPELLDLSQEDQKTQTLYGIGQEPTDAFAKRCLLARKMVENGVRFVQLYAGSWDSHDYIERAHGNLISRVDQPISALLTDLKQRGLLENTLVVWCGEFGRSPDNGVRGGTAYGRDHNPKAMTIWMAGGGVKAGHTIGATDETGAEAAENVHHIRDLHITLLKLLGLDDNKLTYFHGGRFKQLSQFGGEVIQELIA
jgi:hypothetical protein